MDFPHAAVEYRDGARNRRTHEKLGIKTVGFLGYTDAYGESWLRDFTAEADKGGIKVVATERFARADTSVTAQALKLVAANPDAMLVVASGSGAAMPHKAIVERDFKGKIYQTHAAASRDLMRVGGKDVEGAFVVSGPAVVAEQLPDSHPSKKLALAFVTQYEKAYGPGSRNQFAAHGYDAFLVLEKAVPIALKKAKPGTKEFRTALRDALETMGRTVVSHGVLEWNKDDHWGYTMETGVILEGGEWRLESRVNRAMDFSIVSILSLDGATNGAIYALLGLAIVLVFSVTRIIFIPQGEFVAYGALTLAMLQAGQVPGTVWLLLTMALLAAGMAAGATGDDTVVHWRTAPRPGARCGFLPPLRYWLPGPRHGSFRWAYRHCWRWLPCRLVGRWFTDWLISRWQMPAPWCC